MEIQQSFDSIGDSTKQQPTTGPQLGDLKAQGPNGDMGRSYGISVMMIRELRI